MRRPVTPALTIRRALPGDLAELGRLAGLLVRTHHDFDPARFITAGPQTERMYGAYLGGQLENPDVVVLVAERNGQVLGYIYGGVEGPDYMSLRGPAGVIHDIAVDAAERGRGVGRLLLDAMLAALEALGAGQVVLSTAAQNEPAQRLFQRAGFRRTMIEMTRELGGDAS